jgi:similar to stage IV sporulation protein
MLIKLVNWLRGFLIVRIHGTAPERFINMCCSKKIYIWDLRRIGDDYQFHVFKRNYKNLKPIAKKTGMVPKIIHKSGFPFFMHRYRKRGGFFAGVFICLLLVYILSLFIWDISILGGSKYTPEAMLKFLDQKQVYTGIQKKKVDCQEIEETIRLAYNDIGWVSAEIKGTRLIIKITETNMPAPAEIAIEPSHIVATKNGIVKKIITRSGTPLVKVGDVVKKGDILVSGIITVMNDFGEVQSKKTVVADADIVIKSFYEYDELFPLKYIDKDYTSKQKKGYYITILGKKLFLYNPRNSYHKYDIIVNENTLHVTNSFYLPFRYGTITTREYEEVNKIYSEEEAASIATARLQRYFNRLKQNNVSIIENNVKITTENNYSISQGRILVEEPAWEYKTIQEDEWRIEQTDELNGDNH